MHQLFSHHSQRFFAISLLLSSVISLGCRSRSLNLPQERELDLIGVPGTGGTGSLALCAAGEVRCDGAALQRCADDDSSFVTLETCSSAALCQPGSASCGLATCLADEMTCQGNELRLCNFDRTGFDLFSTCESELHCSATERRCLLTPCSTGDMRCNRQADSSATLERCDTAQATWSTVDSCASRQLCDQTLAQRPLGEILLNSDGLPQLDENGAEVSSAAEVVTCLAAACQSGALLCEEATLMHCNEGLTGFEPVEECSSTALCEQSITASTGAGTASCIAEACEPGAFRCSGGGALEVCEEDQTGFRVVQQCIGAAFCDAAAGTCNDAPCQPGTESCNSYQPQRCRDDQTAFDAIGAACLSAALCNDEGDSAFCDDPTCSRGELSSDEYICNGAQLTRCRENRTGYDDAETCLTAELCDSTSGQCQTPLCEVGEHNCEGGFLQLCNAGRTGFDNLESCGDASQCDATAGACTDPCEPGTARCTPQGEIEECQDRLTGWTVTADCLTLDLCDAEARTCTTPACQPGETRCRADGQNTVVERCAAGRHQFDAIDSCQQNEICDAVAGQCDVCQAGSIRCEGDRLLSCSANGQQESTQNCDAGLCSEEAGRCLECGPIGSARCTGLQLLVCTQGQQGEFEGAQDCDTPALCQDTLQGCTGDNCRCRDGVCNPGSVRCNGNRLEQCNAGLNGFNVLDNCEQGLCNAGQARCDQCSGNESTCVSGNRRRFCQNGLFQEQTCSGQQICNGETGQCFDPVCTPGQFNCFGNALQRCNDARTTFNFTQNCEQGLCNAGQSRCDQCAGNESSCIGDNLRQFCNNGLQQTQTCNNGQLCRNNQCVTPACAQGQLNCFGNALQRCSADRTSFDFVQNCEQGLCNQGAGRCDECSPNNFQASCSGNIRTSCNGGFIQSQQCGGGTICQNGQCVQPACNTGQQRCAPGSLVALQRCNADRTGFETVTACAVGCNTQRNACNDCSPGQTGCSDNAVTTCNAQGRLVISACAAGETCSGGQCSAPPTVCTAGEVRCSPNNNADLQGCSAARTEFGTIRTCALGCNRQRNACNDCTPGQASSCLGTNLRSCSAEGRMVIQACSFGNCQGGICPRRICTPNSRRCVNGTIFICSALGGEEIAGTNCGGPLSCSGGECVILR